MISNRTLLPSGAAESVRWNIATMELGALVCTARNPACGQCPLVDRCAWVAAGSPPDDGPPRRGQAWAGTDRQARGRLLDVLRGSSSAVPRAALDLAWERDPMLRELLHGLAISWIDTDDEPVENDAGLAIGSRRIPRSSLPLPGSHNAQNAAAAIATARALSAMASASRARSAGGVAGGS